MVFLEKHIGNTARGKKIKTDWWPINVFDWKGNWLLRLERVENGWREEMFRRFTENNHVKNYISRCVRHILEKIVKLDLFVSKVIQLQHSEAPYPDKFESIEFWEKGKSLKKF